MLPSTTGALLTVRDLSVSFGSVPAVRRVSFHIDPGETVALVGESGSGKSVTALSILQLLPYPLAHHPNGSIRFGTQELVNAPERVLRGLRGNRISMVFQEPMTSLNPLHSVAWQIGETLAVHQGLTGQAARARILELLELVGLPRAEERLGALPHELSGGQRQRVMIAMALANNPDLLIADEPTTALDVTIQAQILELLQDLQRRLSMAVLFITHDLTIVRKMAQRVHVMRGGEIVERGTTKALFAKPRHSYTQRLLAAEPTGTPPVGDPNAPTLVDIRSLKVWFPIKKGVIRRTVGHIKAVNGISFTLGQGQTVGVVGESGSGKTTLGMALLRLTALTEGTIHFDGRPIQDLKGKALRRLRREMQIVFQDPYGSLSPRLSVGQIIEEGLVVHNLQGSKAQRRAHVERALAEVGLDPAVRDRYPHEFSGGQRQRIAIARALALTPRLIVLDEPTSALDVSVQAQIVDLLRDLQRRHRLAYVFISHDLRVVRAMANALLVMKDGEVVEAGPAKVLFDHPRHPYTQQLLAAALDLEINPAADTPLAPP